MEDLFDAIIDGLSVTDLVDELTAIDEAEKFKDPYGRQAYNPHMGDLYKSQGWKGAKIPKEFSGDIEYQGRKMHVSPSVGHYGERPAKAGFGGPRKRSAHRIFVDCDEPGCTAKRIPVGRLHQHMAIHVGHSYETGATRRMRGKKVSEAKTGGWSGDVHGTGAGNPPFQCVDCGQVSPRFKSTCPATGDVHTKPYPSNSPRAKATRANPINRHPSLPCGGCGHPNCGYCA